MMLMLQKVHDNKFKVPVAARIFDNLDEIRFCGGWM